jgi:hypothetical protein
VVLHEFAYTEHKENIALVKDDVIDVRCSLSLSPPSSVRRETESAT